MFLSASLDQIDPALLAFVKCHITSPGRWEVLRILVNQDGAWIRAEQLARQTHRPPPELQRTLADLVSDGLVETQAPQLTEDASYRLPADEPTSIVLHRLIDAATHSQELRAIIAAHLQRIRQMGAELEHESKKVVRAGAAA